MSVEVNIDQVLINKANKEDLINLVSKCQQRTFSEEVNFLEELGGSEVFEELLSVNFRSGIRSHEVESRKAQYGTAFIQETPPKTFMQLVWHSLKDFTLRVLIVASVVSIVANVLVETEHRNIAWIEGFSILMAVAVCSLVGALNDYQKEKQFRKLKEIANQKKEVNVWRDGNLISLHERELVTGDIVKIVEGMDIPADMLVLEAHNLSTDESALTGEPDSIKKKSFAECVAKRDEIVVNGGKNSAGIHDVYSPILMSGTSVLNGEGKALVLVVGTASILGKIKESLVQEAEITPLQVKTDKVIKDISKFGLASGLLIFVILFVRFLIERGVTGTWGEGSKYLDMIDFMIISITVIVVAIPEGLPLSVVLSLAVSMKRMMRDQNLIRKLQATETMGGADNICSDKTGTLTQNEMMLTNFWNDRLVEIKIHEEGRFEDLFNEDCSELMRQALACNSSATLTPLSGSKTEIALLKFMNNYGQDYHSIREKYSQSNILRIPFSSERKRMSIVVDHPTDSNQKVMHIKGASEIILESCNSYYSIHNNEIVPMTEELKERINEEITGMANQALRTLCVAYKGVTEDTRFDARDSKGVHEIEKSGFTLLGVLGIRDILRPEVKGAIETCRRAGVKVRMVTGDNRLTARAIALECGIVDPENEESLVLTGPEFTELTGGIVCKKCRTRECDCPRDKAQAKRVNRPVRIDTIANQEAFDKVYKNLDVLARSRPEDKYALVTGLMERNCVVAVTGDGTNDAPALKKADVGFAMNIGTDVAKEAADIILLDNNFASIVKAVQWGRNIYDNIRKFIQFQFTVNIVATLITIVSSAILQKELLSAIELLWVNLIMDTIVAFVYATESPTPQLLERKPQKRDEYIISRRMAKHIIAQSIYQIILLLILAFTGDKWLPEYLPHEEIPGYPGEQKYYSDGHHMRSGRPRFISENGDDYLRFYDIIGPSRHYTFIFNTFVLLQIFNFINCRKIHDEKNVFEGVIKNRIFIPMTMLIVGIQLAVGNLGGRVFNVSNHGLDVRQWLIAVALCVPTLFLNIILRFVKI